MKEGWTYKKLGEICDIINGFSFKSSLFKDSGNMILRISNIQNGVIDLQNVVYFSTDSYKIDLERYKVYPNDIAIALSGATTGKIGINKTGKELYLNQRVAICREKQNIDHYYLYYYLKTKSEEFLRSAEGVAQPNLSTEEMKTYNVPLPSVDEQQQIVSELDLLSDVIEKKRALIEELDKLAQSSFYDMFGDPITNEKGWEKKKYEEFGSVLGGYAFKSNEFVDDGIPVLKIGNINTGVLKVSDVCFYPYNIKLKNYEVRPGDLTISLTGTTGKDDYGNVCLIPSTYPLYYLNQRNAILKIKDGCNNCYLQYVFKQKTFKMELTKNNHGIRQANILNKDILGLSIPLPPLALQQEFAAKVEAIEQMKAKVRQSLKESEELFNSRMDYYFN